MHKNDLLLLNKAFIDSVNKNPSLKARLEKLTQGQSPKVAIICCSDSRVIPEEIFSSSFGDIFTIRTAGNVINDGELGSIEYALEHLKVDLVLILGHTHCGAVHAALHHEKGKYLDPILSRISRNISNINDEVNASKINTTKERDFLKEKFPEHQEKFVAGIYDIETLKVELL